MKKILLFIAIASLGACKKENSTPKPFDITYKTVYHELIPGFPTANDTLYGCTMRVWEDGDKINAKISEPANEVFDVMLKKSEGSAASTDGKTEIFFINYIARRSKAVAQQHCADDYLFELLTGRQH